MEDKVMEAQHPADPAHPDAPATNEFASLITIFVTPAKTFAGMIGKPRFLVAMIVSIILMGLMGAVMFQSGVVRDETLAILEAKGTPEAQVEATAKFFDSPAGLALSVGGNLIRIPFALLVSAALLLFLGNLMMGAKLRFTHYLSAVTYGTVVGLVDHAIRTALILSRQSLDIRLGLGNLFGEDIGYVVRVLDSMTDPFLLWSMAVTALGVAAYARKGFGFGVVASLPVFLITLLLSGMR
jgi:hypothetical protein